MENCNIAVFKECGKSNIEIARIINGSLEILKIFLQLKIAYGASKLPARPNEINVHQIKTTLR